MKNGRPGAIRDQIKAAREERGLTSSKLSTIAGLHPTYVGKIERGDKNPSIQVILKIASALGVSFEVGVGDG